MKLLKFHRRNDFAGSRVALPAFLAGTGPIGAAIWRHDWALTSLGPIAGWPGPMRAVLATMLRNSLPMVTCWQHDHLLIHNAAFADLIAPLPFECLGARLLDLWPEHAAFHADVLRRVLAGESCSFREREMAVTVEGERRVGWLNFDYSPILDEQGVPLGVLAVLSNVTQAVQAARWIHDERTRAELRSRRARERIWAIYQEMMLVIDAAGRITALNPAVTRATGWEEADLLGRELVAFLREEERDDIARDLRRLTQGAPASGFEARFRTRDGRFRLIRWAAVNEEGAIHAVGRDLTDEHEARRQIQRNWTVSPLMKIVCLASGETIAINPAWTALLGWSEADMIGRDIVDYVVPEQRGQVAAELAQMGEDEPVAQRQYGFLAKSGAHHQLAWTFVAEAGTVYGFARDVTAEQAALAALSASTAERERIWNATNDLMATATLDGDLQSVNPAWTRLLGRAEGDLLNRPICVFFDPPDREKFVAVLRRFNAGACSGEAEARLLHADGGVSLIAWKLEMVAQKIYMVGRDITGQRRAEAALRQAQKMEAVGQLTGGIAHDFNNLLQGITGSLDLLRRRVAQGRVDDLERVAAGAMQAAERAAALTHRLLAFSRRQTLDPRPLEANPLIGAMEVLLRRTLGEKIGLELRLDTELGLTVCDANQLENALLNLVINARDAMPGGGRLVIATANLTIDEAAAARHGDLAAGAYVGISVTDSGTGMSPETIARAFEPFFTTKPTGQGTGLGLSMVYGFVRQSEGHVEIFSRPGYGTEVRLLLPRRFGDPAAPEAVAGAPPLELAEIAGQTVLVIEDEAIVRNLVVEVLADLGYRVLQAEDGPKGLEILQSRQKIDLLVTDIGLPGLNGRQVADAARLIRPRLKILFMTGYAESAAMAGGFSESGMALVTKPFKLDAFSARVRELVDA